MTKNNKLVYRRISMEIVNSLKDELNRVGVSVEIVHDQKMYFGAGNPPEIALYIAEFMGQSVVANICLGAIRELWSALRIYSAASIALATKNDRIVSFILKGGVEESMIEDACEKLSGELQKLDDGNEPAVKKTTIRIRFNSKTKNWEYFDSALTKKFKEWENNKRDTSDRH